MRYQPTQQRAEFQDIEAFRAFMAGWDLRFRQLESGGAGMTVISVVHGDTLVHRYRFTRRLHQQGASPPEALCFGVADPTRITWRDQPVPQGTVLSFNRPGGYESVTESGFNGLQFGVSRSRLRAMADDLGASDRIWSVLEVADVFVPEKALFCSLADALDGMAAKAVLSDPSVGLALQDAMLVSLVRSLDSGADCRAVSPDYRSRVISRVLEYLDANAGQIFVRELYVQAGASWRTLDRAFRDRFGITPKQYLMIDRLTRAHEELRCAAPDRTVSEIATKWGFWHLGRFAALHKRQFGELPSETLTYRPPDPITEKAGNL